VSSIRRERIAVPSPQPVSRKPSPLVQIRNAQNEHLAERVLGHYELAVRRELDL
jgi:hypothetical protein